MASGDALIPRPQHVPIKTADKRITDNVRRLTQLPPRLNQIADVDDTQVPTHRQRYVYDQPTGLFVPISPDDILFSGPGAVQVATSPRFYFRDGGGYVVGLVATLDTAGSSNTVLTLLKNGSSVSGSSTTLGSGVHAVTTTLTAPGTAFSGPYTDYLQVNVTTAGTSAAGLVVHVQRG